VMCRVTMGCDDRPSIRAHGQFGYDKPARR
jgi:hypothetical protein